MVPSLKLALRHFGIVEGLKSCHRSGPQDHALHTKRSIKMDILLNVIRVVYILPYKTALFFRMLKQMCFVQFGKMHY